MIRAAVLAALAVILIALFAPWPAASAELVIGTCKRLDGMPKPDYGPSAAMAILAELGMSSPLKQGIRIPKPPGPVDGLFVARLPGFVLVGIMSGPLFCRGPPVQMELWDAAVRRAVGDDV